MSALVKDNPRRLTTSCHSDWFSSICSTFPVRLMIFSSGQFEIYHFFSTDCLLQFWDNVLRWGEKYFPSSGPYWSGSRSEIAIINIEWDLTNNSFSFLHHKLDDRLQHHQDNGIQALLFFIFRWVKPVVVRQSFYLLQQYSFRVLVMPPKQISPHPKKRRSNFQIFQREAHCMHSFPSVSFRKPSTAALVSSKHFHLQFWRAT